ncbi:MAG TPA: ectonucleotide pyrophosphatase/phosphodiesterase [Usitatibacter sp.]|nr:ectonucleotide pyrophosphatase/phosphodiesterase [Usitatibacter sp.]
MRALSICLVLAFAAGAWAQSPGRHVALISVDGLRPVDVLGAGGCEKPATIAELARSGVHAEGVIGVLPTVTYPSHATLVTGAYPAKHGVPNNDRARDGASWHYDRSDIRIPTLWDAARAKKLSVAIVTWPSSYGADVDYLIPEDLSNARDVAARVKAGSTPGLFDSLESQGGKAISLLPFGDAEAGIPLDDMTGAFAQEVIRRHKPNLLLVHFLDLDHREHTDGIGSPGACASLQRLDHHVAGIRSAYKDAGILDQATFFVVSDHGFAPLHTAINVRELLKQSGMEDAVDVRLAGGSAAVYLKDAGSIAAQVRSRVEARFRGIVRWVAPEEAGQMGGFPGAALVLCAAPGYAFTSSATLPLLVRSQRYRGTHGHCPDEPMMKATFVAAGAGIRPLGVIPLIRMVDIAPTIASLLGIELPNAEGIAILGITAAGK